MKKYIVAGMVAVMAFAFAAFAASLNVNAGTLAFGADEVGDCGGEADITYGHHQENDFAYIDAIIVDFPGGCDALGVYLTSSIGVSVAEVIDDRAVFPITDGQTVNGSNAWDPSINPRQGVAIEDLDGDITITVYSDLSQQSPAGPNTGQDPNGPNPFRTGAFS